MQVVKRKSFIIVSVVFLCVLQYKLWLSSGGLVSNWRVRAQLNEQERTNIKLQSRNVKLASDIKRWKAGDASVIEARARRDLGMIKQGEVFYQLANS